VIGPRDYRSTHVGPTDRSTAREWMRASLRARTSWTRDCCDLVSSLDTVRKFVLDIRFFSSIIYILYEGESLRPPVVTHCFAARVETPSLRRKNGEEGKEGGQEEGCEEAVTSCRAGVTHLVTPYFFQTTFVPRPQRSSPPRADGHVRWTRGGRHRGQAIVGQAARNRDRPRCGLTRTLNPERGDQERWRRKRRPRRRLARSANSAFSRSARPKGLLASPFFLLLPVPHAHAANQIALGEPIRHVHALHDFANHGVLRVEVRLR
jgi:hypothetical protein